MIPDWIEPPDLGMPDPEIEYYPDGETLRAIHYSNIEGKPSRTGGPAHIVWYPNGTLRLEAWLLDGEYHRTDGPAITNWHQNGLRSSEEWRQENYTHRAGDKPAESRWNIRGELASEAWWVDGTQIAQEFYELEPA